MSALDAEPIPLSALQHAVYCLRQAALIHLERLWSENRFTAEGDVLHAVADKGGMRKGRGVRRVMALPLASRRLNLSGVADLVEFHPAGSGGEVPFPVEYKRGRPKAHRADEVQLCAQALCLEHMLGQHIAVGALYYGETRRRQDVVFDEDLRALTMQTIEAVRAMFASGCTPQAVYDPKRCDRCSLLTDCRPQMLGRAGGVRRWLEAQLRST